MLSDTSPEAKRVLIELLRRASPAERIAAVRAMTIRATEWSRRAIAEAHPELSSREVDLKWVEVHYGKYLARQLREYLENRPCNPET